MSHTDSIQECWYCVVDHMEVVSHPQANLVCSRVVSTNLLSANRLDHFTWKFKHTDIQKEIMLPGG